jgi:aspartyl/asparaginyl beta-hydroxylase (cupin superfamily)
MFNGRTDPIRIIGDLDNQRPDNWSPAVLTLEKKLTIALKRSPVETEATGVLNELQSRQFSWAAIAQSV